MQPRTDAVKLHQRLSFIGKLLNFSSLQQKLGRKRKIWLNKKCIVQRQRLSCLHQCIGNLTDAHSMPSFIVSRKRRNCEIGFFYCYIALLLWLSYLPILERKFKCTWSSTTSFHWSFSLLGGCFFLPIGFINPPKTKLQETKRKWVAIATSY